MASFFFLPNGVVVSVLLCLPLKEIIKCQLVCKRWKRLIFKSYFLERSPEIILPGVLVLQKSTPSKSFLFAVERSCKLTGVMFQTRFFTHYSGYVFPDLDLDDVYEEERILLSHGGIVVWYMTRTPDTFIITNPARSRDEQLRINISRESEKSFWAEKCIYGVYFQSGIGAHCCLLRIGKKFFIIALTEVPALREVHNPFYKRKKRYQPPPLLINDLIYWMLRSEQPYHGRNDVMFFDTVREDFQIIQCPVPMSVNCSEWHTHLVSEDGVVSFVLICPDKISIWRLKEHRLWMESEYELSIPVLKWDLNMRTIVRGVVIVDGKLALLVRGKLRLCNFMERTYENFPVSHRFLGDTSLVSHQTTLNSVINCSQTIFILEVGSGVLIHRSESEPLTQVPSSSNLESFSW